MNGLPIQIEGLSFSYPDGTPALNGVSFAVEAGASVALVGANGAGKSTLLLHLNACLFASAGQVRVGETVASRETAPQLRQAVGLIFQDPDDQLFTPTVFDDVAFAPRHRRLPPAEVERMAVDALRQVGMEHLRERPPYRLSAGEKRSVAIAAVLAQSPSVLALDEPSANLDPRARRRLIDLLCRLEPTRVVATHDLELALAVCEYTVVLDNGKVAAQGRTRELLANEGLMLEHGLERPASLSAG